MAEIAGMSSDTLIAGMNKFFTFLDIYIPYNNDPEICKQTKTLPWPCHYLQPSTEILSHY